MKCVRGESLGSVAGYKLEDVAASSPGPGEVLVAIQSCGMGYVDALIATGGYQVKPPLPFVPGQETAGVVLAAGEGAPFLEGDRVMASGFGGGLAEMAVYPGLAVWKIPDRMSFDQGAIFRVNYLTALHALMDRAKLRDGETLLVMGAAGGVGTAAVQIGTLLGARVIACASTAEKRDFAGSHGAVATIDTATDGWRERLKAHCGGSGPDVVFDPVCGQLFEAAFRSQRWGGRYLVVGFAGGPIPNLPANLPLMKGAAMIGVDVRQFLLFERDHADDHMARLLGWVADGRLVPPVGRRFPLEDFQEAMNHALSGQSLGKAVVSLSQSG